MTIVLKTTSSKVNKGLSLLRTISDRDRLYSVVNLNRNILTLENYKMRKIEQQMVDAINRRVDFSSANTLVVKIDDVNSAIYLHGNHIADVNSRNGLVLVNTDTLARWSTNTTKSRLRALGANVSTRKGVTYLNDVAI